MFIEPVEPLLVTRDTLVPTRNCLQECFVQYLAVILTCVMQASTIAEIAVYNNGGYLNVLTHGLYACMFVV